MVLPAAIEDANPFERQATNDGLMLFAASTMLVVIRAGPFAASQRVLCPFLKRLPHKFRTSPTHMDPTLFAARLLYRCNPAIALQFVCAAKPVALRAQRGDQARSKRLPHTRKRMHKREVRVRFGQLLNALALFPNRLM